MLRLLFFGKIRKYKGLSVFLDVLARLKKEIPFKATVAGEFYVDPAPYRRTADRLGLSDQMRWKERYVPNEEVPHVMRDIDIFVNSSVVPESFGVAVLEASACGVPVGALPVPGPNDVIGDSGAGVLDHDLGRAIDAAIGIDPELCRAHALTQSWERSAREFYTNLVPIKVAQLQGETA